MHGIWVCNGSVCIPVGLLSCESAVERIVGMRWIEARRHGLTV